LACLQSGRRKLIRAASIVLAHLEPES
jgi:hypothetical protein